MNTYSNQRDPSENTLSTRFILLPIYNEEENLANLIDELQMADPSVTTRLIAVNDGSNDKSLSVLHQKLRESDLLRSYRINMNVGAVFCEGINTFLEEGVPGDTLFIMESDGTSDVAALNTLESTLCAENCDIVIASRFRTTGGYMRFPLKRKILSFGANLLMRKRFPIPNVTDYTIFFRIYRYEILNLMVAWYGRQGSIRSKGFAANAELLVKASLLDARINEIPYRYDYGNKKGKSKLPIFSTFVEYISMWIELDRVYKKLSRTRS